MMSPTERPPRRPAAVCSETPGDPPEDDYAPLLLAFGPADHDYESEGSDDADAYIVGYN